MAIGALSIAASPSAYALDIHEPDYSSWGWTDSSGNHDDVVAILGHFCGFDNTCDSYPDLVYLVFQNNSSGSRSGECKFVRLADADDGLDDNVIVRTGDGHDALLLNKSSSHNATHVTCSNINNMTYYFNQLGVNGGDDFVSWLNGYWVAMQGWDGNDFISMGIYTGQEYSMSYAHGVNDDDLLISGSEDSVLVGGSGDDRLRHDNNTPSGSSGGSLLYGQNGDDCLQSQAVGCSASHPTSEKVTLNCGGDVVEDKVVAADDDCIVNAQLMCEVSASTQCMGRAPSDGCSSDADCASDGANPPRGGQCVGGFCAQFW